MNAQRHYDSLTPETIDPPQRAITLAEQEVEGASKGRCRCCDNWKRVSDITGWCDECMDDLEACNDCHS